tara:strand:- start:87 stop:386 length:300 start_codon:yes stop_codon:yes gene_type:complete
MIVYYSFITTILGLARDKSKNKDFCIFKFTRTIFLTSFINFVLSFIYSENSELYSVILERWGMLLYKSIYSFLYFNEELYRLNKVKKYINDDVKINVIV